MLLAGGGGGWGSSAGGWDLLAGRALQAAWSIAGYSAEKQEDKEEIIQRFCSGRDS